MADGRDKPIRPTLVLMLCGFLLTLPALIYGVISMFYQRSLNVMIIESGHVNMLHFVGLISLLLPIAGLLLVLYARLLILSQNSKYNFYQAHNNHLLYNNLFMAYFILLSVLIIIYLEVS